MSRYLIEVPHEDHMAACTKAARDLLSTGSHFLTNADWGCDDGEHKAWVIVDVSNKDEARGILPPDLRSSAKIVQLNKLTLDLIDQMTEKQN